MRVSRVLQLFILLAGLCLARHTPPPDTPSSTQEAGQVPMSHLKMLSLGLAHLLQGVEENAGRLGKQGEQVAAELDTAAKTLESLRKQGLQAGRTHRQVRKDLQMLSAKGDRLERAVQDLQRGFRDLVTEQGSLELRMSQILQRMKSVSETASGSQTQLNMSLMKVIVDKQARRLANLASEVTARDRVIDRRLQHIEHLEKQVSGIRGGKPPCRAEGRF